MCKFSKEDDFSFSQEMNQNKYNCIRGSSTKVFLFPVVFNENYFLLQILGAYMYIFC